MQRAEPLNTAIERVFIPIQKRKYTARNTFNSYDATCREKSYIELDKL